MASEGRPGNMFEGKSYELFVFVFVHVVFMFVPGFRLAPTGSRPDFSQAQRISV